MNRFKLLRACACMVFSMLVVSARADVRLPNLFSSHMVLQQEKPMVIWGWAAPHEKVTVEIASNKAETEANDRGEWKVTLPAMKASGPFTLKITGGNVLAFDDVMVGEVWLCSGQSNMEMGMTMIQDSQKEISNARQPGLRLLLVKRKFSPLPETNIDGQWKLCTPETVAQDSWGGFSAAAYFFGRELHKKLGVTVGLIESSWGGTRIESWTPPEGFADVQSLGNEYAAQQLADPRSPAHRKRFEQTLAEVRQWLDAAGQSLTNGEVAPPMPSYPAEMLPPHDVQNATALYNGMIYPLVPFAIRGAIWYQGESNLRDGSLYTDRMKALITGWRQVWRTQDLPFYYVQIAPFNYGGDPEAEGVFWEAQAQANSIPNTGMAVINDIGNIKDIHPKNKQEVGRRLALWAMAKTYGYKSIAYSGPVFRSMVAQGNQLTVSFDQTGGKLASRDGKPLDSFEIIDTDDGGFVKADAKIDGDNIILTAPGVSHPAAMRFAWSMFAEPNLVNAAGLPAGAFRAGQVPKRDLLLYKIPEAKDYKVVYDLDLARLGADIQYDVDAHESIQQPFDRIAYFLELQNEAGQSQYLYVSMDAFTNNLAAIGVPTVKSGASFQQNVSNLDVFSNVKGIVEGTNMKGGNIEFWPNNYGQENEAKVPNASSQTYDFGDQMIEPADGYGSMQVHNHHAKQTLFALNHWREGQKADLGIGNQSEGQPDWTFAANANKWQMKRLRVLVRCK